MNYKFLKKTTILSLIFLVVFSLTSHVLVKAEATNENKTPVLIHYNNNDTPYNFGNPTTVDISALQIENGVVTSISQEEFARLYQEASKHNTPIILDLSNEQITSINDDVFAYAPIHILKLPATIQKIGNNAFKGALIHQIYFKNDPSTINIGTDAFKQAVPVIVQGGFVNAQLVDSSTYLPIGQDFTFYGMVRDENAPNGIAKQENPYFIDVNGVKTYAVLTSDDPELFAYSTDPRVASPTVDLLPSAYTNFSNGNLKISSPKAVKYELSIPSVNGNVSLSGENYIAFNRAVYLDATPQVNEKGEYTVSYRPVGESTGLDANILTAALQSEGYTIVGLNQIYPNLDEAQIKEIVKDLQEKYFNIDALYSNPANLYVNHINKKYEDIVFVARPTKVNYTYYDKETGEQLGGEELNTFIGVSFPKFTAPDGYKPFIEDLKKFPRVLGEDTLLIPVVKSSEVTVTIDFVNESGFRVGPTFYLTGNENEKIDLNSNKEISNFIRDYKVEMLEQFDESFSKDKSFVIRTKGKLSDLIGPAGATGAKGDKGDAGVAGIDGKPGKTEIITRTYTEKIDPIEIAKAIVNNQEAISLINNSEYIKSLEEKINNLNQNIDDLKSSCDVKLKSGDGDVNELSAGGHCRYYKIIGIKFKWCLWWDFYWLLLLTISFIINRILVYRKENKFKERLEEIEEILSDNNLLDDGKK